jgi:hypothetical protein
MVQKMHIKYNKVNIVCCDDRLSFRRIKYAEDINDEDQDLEKAKVDSTV